MYRTLFSLAIVLFGACFTACVSDPVASSAADVRDPGWLTDVRSDADVHLIELPPNLHSYADAWVYQFGEYSTWQDALTSGPCAATRPHCPVGDSCSGGLCWSDTLHNNECGPACVQIMQRFTGRLLGGLSPGVGDCSWRSSIAGCEAFPDVHTMCHAIGRCTDTTGFSDSSYAVNSSTQVSTVLRNLGFTTRVYTRGDITLSVAKRAVDANHPIIVAVNPSVYREGAVLILTLAHEASSPASA